MYQRAIIEEFESMMELQTMRRRVKKACRLSDTVLPIAGIVLSLASFQPMVGYSCCNIYQVKPVI